MRRYPLSTLLLLAGLLPGCASLDSIGSGQHDPDATSFPLSKREEQPLSKSAPDLDRQVLRQEVTQTAIGSVVSIKTESELDLRGTLISLSGDKIELWNCLGLEIGVDKTGRKFAKRTHTPSREIEIEKLTHFSVFASPSPGFDARKLRSVTSDTAIGEIVLMSGRRMQFGAAVDLESWNPKLESAEQWSRKITRTARGVQVAFVDDTGRQFHGIVSSADADELRLINCICQEIVPGTREKSQTKTTHLPIHTVSPASIVAFGIAPAEPLDRDFPRVGEDSEEFIVTAFVTESGRQIPWGKK